MSGLIRGPIKYQISQSFLFPFTLLFITTTARVQRKEETRNSSFFSPFPWKQKSPFYRAPKLLTVSPARSGFGTLPKHHPFHALFKLSNTSNPPPSTAYRKTIYSYSTTVSGMANPPEGYSDDFLEQILSMPSYAGSDGNLAGTAMGLQLGSGEAGSGFPSAVYPPLGLSLEQGSGSFAKAEEASGSGKRFREESGGKASVKMERDAVHLSTLFPPFGHVQPISVRPTAPPPQPFHGQSTQGTVTVAPHPPAIRPRVRARRGQATDPHSIAERLRRERIAERMKALQELVPSSNKSDRAAMLDEIVDYVKFLRLQVKVLSMSRLGGAGAVAQLVADIPLPSVEGDASESGSSQQAWEKLSTDGTERQVAKLMEEDVGAAMQFLQSKALCIMPISLAAAIYHTQPPDAPMHVKPEPNAPS